ncbi:splicing regulator SDE2 [Spea bombifrons]|uniref:splicing regulator SDE2 n=1 Tax=Spea bombifrons TaxID=233779 RepID=UPI00234BDF89|nr:splicing regulator SDE2 [Spea bombifrons]
MEAVVWVREAFTGRVSVARRPHGSVVRDLLPPQASALPDDFYVKCDGRLVGLDEELRDGLAYSLEPRLRGGKGGFGSMLRALGAQIEKTTNREACRDLSGRRLRDVNHEKAMAEWIKKQAEREAEKEQRRLERLKRKLAEPKHYFTDPEYHRQCEDMAETLEDSVIKGLQASSSTAVSAKGKESRKRKTEGESSKSKHDKRKCLWTGVEGLDISSASDSGSDSDSESPSTSSHSTDPKPCSSESPSDSDGCETRLPPPDALPFIQEQKEAGSLLQEGPTDPQTSESEEVTPPAEATMSESQEPEKEKERPAPEIQDMDSSPTDLLAFSSAAELEALGLEKLKQELLALGLKCGGTLQERAARLFSVRGLSKEQIDPSLFAKPTKGKRK